jgi:hypothetical protein
MDNQSRLNSNRSTIIAPAADLLQPTKQSSGTNNNRSTIYSYKRAQNTNMRRSGSEAPVPWKEDERAFARRSILRREGTGLGFVLGGDREGRRGWEFIGGSGGREEESHQATPPVTTTGSDRRRRGGCGGRGRSPCARTTLYCRITKFFLYLIYIIFKSQSKIHYIQVSVQNTLYSSLNVIRQDWDIELCLFYILKSQSKIHYILI